MRNDEKSRHEASRLVIALRKALGKTQQEFAVEIVKTTIGTVAVWETTRPPKGDTLLRLADAAWDSGQSSLSNDFELLWFDEMLPRLRSKGIFRIGPNDDKSGYLMYRFNAKNAKDIVPLLLDKVDKIAEIAQAEEQTTKRKTQKKG